MNNTSIEILKAAEAYNHQLQIRNALIDEQNETEQKYNRLATQLQEANKQLRYLKDQLLSVSGGVV